MNTRVREVTRPTSEVRGAASATEGPHDKHQVKDARKPRRTTTRPLSVLIVGAGNVGRSLRSELRIAQVPCKLWRYRAKASRNLGDATVVFICTRDGQLPDVVTALCQQKLPDDLVVAHVAGALGPEVLSALREHGASVAQAHPYASILSSAKTPLSGVPFLLNGDRVAIARLRQILRLIGARAVVAAKIEPATYHLSAALLANGAVALLSHAEELLADAGIPAQARLLMLLSLLNTVQNNVRQLGLSRALTGPVRRGDAKTVSCHFAVLKASRSATLPLYRALVAAQLELVRGYGELTAMELCALERLVSGRKRAR
jgi:predicted short-subunit dehydrogenase-like oxidoreductase (DUF2520 family)